MTTQMRICVYCGNNTDGDPCSDCGGARDAAVKANIREYKWQPYAINGYIVWPTSVDDFETILRYHFYLGDQLVETIQFPRHFVYLIEGYDNTSFSIRDFVWKLFLIAQGEEKVLEVVEKNSRPPARFEIRRIEPKKLTEEEATEYWIERYQ